MDAWFAVYGPDLLQRVLSCRLAGGRPPGAKTDGIRGRDPVLPRSDRAIFLPHRLLFGGLDPVWGGAQALLDPSPNPEVRTLARIWACSALQREDLARQIIGIPDLGLSPPWPVLGTAQPLANGWSLLQAAACDGCPVLALTRDPLPQPSPPSATGLATLIAGLRETFGLNRKGILDYLRPVPGIRSTELATAFARSEALLQHEAPEAN